MLQPRRFGRQTQACYPGTKFSSAPLTFSEPWTDVGFPILLTCSGRSGVAVGIILRKEAGLYHPERLSGLGGGGARATQPGAGRPASPWVATTDPTLCAKAVTVRDLDRCGRGGSPAKGPLPHAASARGRITPQSPQVARGAERRGCVLHPQTSRPARRGVAPTSRLRQVLDLRSSPGLGPAPDAGAR